MLTRVRYGHHTQTMLPGRENGGNLDTSAECVSGETSWIYTSNGKLGSANYVFFPPRKPGCLSIVYGTKWKLCEKVQYLRAPRKHLPGFISSEPHHTVQAPEQLAQVRSSNAPLACTPSPHLT